MTARTVARIAALLLTIGAAGSAVRGAEPAKYGDVDDARIANAANEPQNWLTPDGGWLEQNYSGLDQINVGTVSRLKPAWSFDVDSVRKQESQPIVVDGIMYVTAAWSHVYALDAKTGKMLWHYDPEVAGHTGVRTCCDVDNRGVAVYKGKVIAGTLDGRLVALDAKTGKVIWSVRTFSTDSEYTITGQPRVFHDKVVIGNAGSDFGIQGFIAAYDVNTGKRIWKFFLTPSDPKKGPDHLASDSVQKMMQASWYGKTVYLHGGGGSCWNTIVYDPKYNLIMCGTANGSPTNPWVRSDGKGTNLFTASIVAVNADTGKYAWHYQENPLEAWDYDATAPIMLATVKVDGVDRDVAMHLPKNGFMYLLDRKTGKLLAADKSRPEINWTTGINMQTGVPIDIPESRYEKAPFTVYPASGGAHNWDQWSLSPKTGLVYVPLSIGGSTYQVALKQLDIWYKDGPNNQGTNDKLPRLTAPVVGQPYLAAWDPAARKVVWKSDVRGNGVLSTAGNLVFQGGGGFSGELWAVRADTGEKVWSAHTPNNLTGGPVSYMVDGEQYIAIEGGSGTGSVADARAEQPGRVFVFKLDGAGTFPPDPPKANPVVVPTETFSAESIKRGQHLFGQVGLNNFCARCHGGTGTRAANNLPDLRRAPELADKAIWKKVVLDGAFDHYGMVSWKRYVSPQDAEDIRAFVASEAKKLADSEKGQKTNLGGAVTPGAE